VDGFELVALVITLATVTSWVGMRGAIDKDGYHTILKEMPLAVICVTISWIAALLVGIWTLL
jgi:hypothetical protein